MKREWQTRFRELEQELAALERRRDEIDRAIARLRQVVTWFRAHQRSGSIDAQSLTGACRAALRTAPAGLTPLEVKRSSTLNGFDWKRFTNPMSAVHTVLKRLVAQRDATTKVDPRGHRRFVWARPPWSDDPRSQAEEAARIEHLLDGVVSDREFADMLRRWRATVGVGVPATTTVALRRRPAKPRGSR